jgi:hypothetical protein
MSKMAKRLGAGASVVLATGLLVAWLAPASLAQTQIQVLDHEGPYEKQIDLGKAGFSAGDVTLGSHQLFDAASPTTVVGRDFERLTILRVVAGGQDADFVYDSTLRLADGDILLYGEGRLSDIFTTSGATIAAIGGTGAYQGMVGAATFTATANEGEFLIAVDLLAG